MKNLIKTGLLSVALMTAAITNASEKLNVKVAPASKMLSIEMTKVVEGETLTIKDIQGEVLFTEKLAQSNEYSKVFSFSTLPEGVYFVESKEATKIQVTPVIVNNEAVALVADASKTYLAPKITVDGDLIKVMVRNYSKVPVTIAVYDEVGSLLTKTETNTNTLVFGTFKTADLNTRKLTLSVIEGDYSFIEEVEL